MAPAFALYQNALRGPSTNGGLDDGEISYIVKFENDWMFTILILGRFL